MKVKVQVVTITDDGQEITKESGRVERQDMTPQDIGPLVGRRQGITPGHSRGRGGVADVRVSPAITPLSTWRQAAPQQGRASHGISDRLRDALGRKSSALSVWVSGPRDHCAGLHECQCGLPGWPQPRPEEAISRMETRAVNRLLIHRELMPQRKIFRAQ